MNKQITSTETESLMKRIQELEGEVLVLRRRADHDDLTGCLRREAFVTLIEKRRAFGLLDRNQSLVIMDIDHFKSINDRFGHHAGDEALQFVAQTLQNELPHGSLLCRMGGEEFVALIPMELSAARNAVEDVREMFAAKNFRSDDGHEFALTLSFGLVNWDSDTSLLESSARADAALYKAKNSGRNRVVCDDLKKSA